MHSGGDKQGCHPLVTDGESGKETLRENYTGGTKHEYCKGPQIHQGFPPSFPKNRLLTELFYLVFVWGWGEVYKEYILMDSLH